MMETVRFELLDGGIGLVTIDVPGSDENRLGNTLLRDLDRLVERIRSDDSICGAVLASAKKASFLASADAAETLAAVESADSAQQAAALARSISDVFRKLETCGKPVAAAIGGAALGGGLELCLACHFRIVADDTLARIGFPDVNVGLPPTAGGTQRLPRLIGVEKALPILLEGRLLTPQEALAAGIVDAVASAEELISAALAWVRRHERARQPWDERDFAIPGGAGAQAPHARRTFTAGTAFLKARDGENYPLAKMILSSVFEGTVVSIDVGLKIEAKYFGKVASHAVTRNLLRTGVVSRRRADSLEWRPAVAKGTPVGKLGVIGAGMMGAGIALAAASKGIDVRLMDRDRTTVEAALARLAGVLEREQAAGRVHSARAGEILARIKPFDEIAALSDVDLMIEAVYEDRKLKETILASAAAAMRKDALIASNTSTISITRIAEATRRRDGFIGIHFFSPVHRMPLVELISGRETSQSTLARAMDFVRQIGRTPIAVNDSPGFYTSRVFCSYIDEAMAMLAEGVRPSLIENAARIAGMPIGPLAVTDEVTLDLQQLVVRQAEEDDVPPQRRRQHARAVIDKMNELGRLGRKIGRGFYDYGQGGRALWTGIGDHFPVRNQQPHVAEVRDRLLYIQALESARCLEEGVLTNPIDADLGSVLGIGFPRWTGGTLSFIDTVGIRNFTDRLHQLAAAHGERFTPSLWFEERAVRGARFVRTVAEQAA